MKLYLDANIIIYAYEAHEPNRSIVRSRIFQCVAEGGDLLTSLFSRLECRVVPVRQQNLTLLKAYDDFFDGTAATLIRITPNVIDVATSLRAHLGIKAVDSIHLASAIVAKADRFLTGDAMLSRCTDIPVEVLTFP